jgi:acetyltransferase
VAAALCALRATDPGTPRLSPSVEGVDEREVTDVLFGPRRALSDPASKAALTPYGIPVPLEELCGSASRAASEASRIGYPVRISLASPDLRIWDHPDLTVDMVDNAARVRDTFHQLMGVAKARLDGGSDTSERILGAMVTATSDAVARLGVVAWPLSGGRVAMDIGFADPHGRAADDRTLAVLPAPLGAIERALRRLRGHSLVLGGSAAQRRTHLEAIGDVLLRLAAFVHDRRDDVESVELRPVALLLDGTVEVREACVRVSDAFERSLRGAAAR